MVEPINIGTLVVKELKVVDDSLVFPIQMQCFMFIGAMVSSYMSSTKKEGKQHGQNGCSFDQKWYYSVQFSIQDIHCAVKSLNVIKN